MVFILVVLSLLFLLLLVVARNHARGMTQFKERSDDYSPDNRYLKIVKTSLFGFNAYRSKVTLTPRDFGRDYSRHRMKSESGVELAGWYISRTNSKGMVVLFNWFGGCKSDNLEAAEVFLDLGYEVFLLDLRGHGDSSGMETFFGYREYRDVLAAVEYVRYNFEPRKLVLYGVSLGAVATMRAYHAGEINVDALILEAPFDRLINTIRHRVDALHVPSFIFADLLVVVGGIRQGYNPYVLNPVDYAGEIGVPVLLIHGRCDPFVTCGEVERLFDNFPNNILSELVLVSGHGHRAVIYSNSALFKDRVSKFLEKI